MPMCSQRVDRAGVERELGVEITGQADAIGAAAHRRGPACEVFGRMAGQMFLNGPFKCDFLGIADHAAP